MKIVKCIKCRKFLELSEFHKRGKNKNGDQIYRNDCKECFIKSIDRGKALEYAKKYRIENREKQLASQKKYRAKNKDKTSEYNKINKEASRRRVKEWISRNKDNEMYASKKSIRDAVRRGFKNINTPKARKTEEILGCSFEFFRSHIESMFLDGMSWSNHGYYGWHLDHIIPISSAKTLEDINKLSHYTNFQPLWWIDNLRKSNKY